MKLTPASINPGNFSARPLRAAIKKSYKELIICGVYVTNISSKPEISCNAPSAIAGTHSTRTSTKLRTTAFIASPIAGALSAMTPQNATIPSPILVRINGIRDATPPTIIASPEAIATAPPVIAAANAVIPTDSANTPAPAASIPTPNNAIEPDNPIIAGTRGLSIRPATPITANAPAMETRPFAIESQLIPPRIFITGVRSARAPAATSNAAEPPIVPVIAFSPMANIAIDPPTAARPLPISDHFIPPVFSRTSDMITNAVETAIKPTPIPTIFLGMILVEIATAASAPAIAARPLPISSQLIWDRSFTADANIFIDPPIAIIPIPSDAMPLTLLVSFENTASSVSNPPIPASPLPSSSQLI